MNYFFFRYFCRNKFRFYLFSGHFPIALTSGQGSMPGPGHGRGLFRPWVCNGSDNALNLLAEAAEIRGGESILRTNVGNSVFSGSCADNNQPHQPVNPKLMDIGNDPNLQSDDVHMADSSDLHHLFSNLDDFDLGLSAFEIEAEMLEIQNFDLNLEAPHSLYPDFPDPEDSP